MMSSKVLDVRWRSSTLAPLQPQEVSNATGEGPLIDRFKPRSVPANLTSLQDTEATNRHVVAVSVRQGECATGNSPQLDLPQREHVSWAATISRHTKSGQGRKALKVYEDLRERGEKLNSYIFVAALKACRNLHDLEVGRQIHEHVVESGFASDAFVGTTLVDLYVKCGSLVDGRTVFEQLPHRDVVCWNAMILGYAQKNEGEMALQLYERMQQEGVVPNERTFVAALKACSSLAGLEVEQGSEVEKLFAKKRCLDRVRAIHSRIERTGSELPVFVGTMLVDVYGKCGSLVDARYVFDNMPHKDVVSWNVMISGYAHMQEGIKALDLYAQMQQEGLVPDDRTFVVALKACTSLSSLNEGNPADRVVKKQCLEHVRALHSDVVKCAFESNLFVGNMLIDVYAKCGSLVDARHVFENMPHRDVVSWTTMILANAQMDEGAQALQIYARMQKEGVVPVDRTYVAALKACSALAALEEEHTVAGIPVKKGCLEQVRAIHSHVLAIRSELDVFVGTMLVDVYGKCGSLVDARCVFEKLHHRDVVSWNAIILGYAQMEQGEEALRLYARMLQEGVQPDTGTFVSALKACSKLAATSEVNKGDKGSLGNQLVEQVKAIHSKIESDGPELDVTVGSMLVDVYAKCGSLVDARHVFEKMPHRNVVSWNAMILGCAQMEDGEEALQLYTRMQKEGVMPDDRTFVSALKACSSLAALAGGNQADDVLVKSQCLERVQTIHSDAAKRGCESNIFVGTMLVDVYAKCGSLVNARRVFEKMPHRDTVSWNAMILGYAQMEDGETALDLYARMKEEGLVPNDRTFVGALMACGVVSGLDRGKQIHAEISKLGLEATDVFVASSLIDMYGKCGCMVDAQTVFETLPRRDTVTWNALIVGYARQGESEVVFSLFQRMREESVKPDGMIFLSLILACSHEGLVDKGQKYFEAMSRDYGISPTIDHYTCMVDLFGRAGQLNKAMAIVKTMPFQADGVVWQTVLAACQKWSDVNLGREAFDYAVQLDKNDVSAYVLMSNIYSAAHMFEEAEKMQAMRLKAGALKQPGQTWWTDFRGVVHTFGVEDQEHPESHYIYNKLQDLTDKMMERDCLPQPKNAWNAEKANSRTLGKRYFTEGTVLEPFLQTENALRICAAKVGEVLSKSDLVVVHESQHSGNKSVKETISMDPPKWVTKASERVQLSTRVGGGSSGSGGRFCAPSDPRNLVDLKLLQPYRLSWAARMSQHTKCGQGRQALKIYDEMRKRGVKPSSYTFVAALKACGSLQDLELGKQIHSHVVDSGFDLDVFVGTTLVDLYVKCGSLADAREVFEKMPNRDVVCWNAMILGYAQLEEGEVALQLHSRMQQEGVVPNNRTFVGLLKACSSLAARVEGNEADGLHVKTQCLEQVRSIHSLMGSGSPLDLFVGTMLVDVYSKCGSLVDARSVFEKMPHRDVVSWNAMILGYSQMDEGEVALQLYAQMQQEGAVANDGTFVGALKACCSLAGSEEGNDGMFSRRQCLEQVRAIHSQIVVNGYKSDIYVGTMLVGAYAKCGSLVDARYVFEEMTRRDLVAWNAMIQGYAQMDEGQAALEMYARMLQEGIVPESRTFVCTLKACSSIATLEEGKISHGKLVKTCCLEQVRAIHSDIMRSGFESDVFVANILVDVYAKCGSLVDARHVFERIPHRDVISWTAMIFGYAQVEEGEKALELYERMQQEDVVPNDRAFVGALKACRSLAALEEGNEFDGRLVKRRCLEQVRAIHSKVANKTSEIGVFVGTMLVDVYAKCGSLEDARLVFEQMCHRDVAAWNAMILGCAQSDEGEEALQFFTRMREEGVAPDIQTFVAVLKACTSLTGMKVGNSVDGMMLNTRCLEQVRAIHSSIAGTQFELDTYVGTMLVDVYSKCGCLVDARCIFEKIRHRDVVSWNAVILAYAQMDDGEAALELYDRMQHEGLAPNDRTFVGALKACGGVACLEKGMEIHAQISQTGLGTTDSYVASGLIDMYGKCGCMAQAQEVYDSLLTRDIVARNALIAGYARQGDCERVFDLLERMKHEGIQPEAITFVSVLSVCSHVGLLDKGQKYFQGMSVEFGISPTVQHYTCMIDLLGRAGQVDEAMAMAQTMPFLPDATVWEALLGACRKWRKVVLGRQAFECAVKLNRQDTAAYVLMSNIYAAAHQWEDVKEIQAMRMRARAWKQQGQSRWTDLSGTVHVFGAGDQEHPESQLIHAKVRDLVVKIKGAGYVPHLESVLRDIPDAEKEDALCGHSEKLAMAYALQKTPEGTTIRVVKNLRVCEDCHTATAWISKVEKRTIICRDSSRFHVYKDGQCSCGDYW